MNAPLQKEMKKRNLVHAFTQGRSPKSTRTAELFVCFAKPIGRRMLVSAMRGMSHWPWAVEYVSKFVRDNALKTMPNTLP